MNLKRHRVGLIIIGPFLAGLEVYYILPILMMLYSSVVKNGVFTPIESYLEVYGSSTFRLAVKNTILFTVTGVSSITIFSLILSVIVNKMTFYKEHIKSLMIAPLIVPSVSIIMVLDLILSGNGILNTVFISLGMDKLDFLNSSITFYVTILFYLWKNMGYNIIIISAAMENVPKQLYEAAGIDGATPMQSFFHITLPSIKPTMVFVIVISILNSFKAFREIYLLLGAYPNESVYSIQHYMNNLFAVLDINKLSVVAISTFLIIISIIALIMKWDRS